MTGLSVSKKARVGVGDALSACRITVPADMIDRLQVDGIPIVTVVTLDNAGTIINVEHRQDEEQK